MCPDVVPVDFSFPTHTVSPSNSSGRLRCGFELVAELQKAVSRNHPTLIAASPSWFCTRRTKLAQKEPQNRKPVLTAPFRLLGPGPIQPAYMGSGLRKGDSGKSKDTAGSEISVPFLITFVDMATEGCGKSVIVCDFSC